MKYQIMAGLLLAASILPAQRTTTQRARITGGGGSDGKCTIEVEVDGAAEIEVSGDSGRMRTLSGSPANWRRFQCNAPMPRNFGDFRFRGIDGRGRQTLIQDPRGNGGRAVVRIEDSQGGREGYTFDLEWRGGGGGFPGGGGGGFPGGPGGGGPPRRIAVERAISICQDAVTSRLERDGYRNIRISRIVPDDNPGRRDWIIGSAEGRRRNNGDSFSFTCSVDFDSGRVRSADVRRR